MVRGRFLGSNKSIFVLVALICFALGVLNAAGILTVSGISWTDLGLFFGFLSFLF